MKTIKTKKFDVTPGDQIWFTVEVICTGVGMLVSMLLTKAACKAVGAEDETQAPALIDDKLRDREDGN